MSAALVVRAGALGDVLLLRPLIAGLRERYERVDLLAPLASGRALLGREPGDVDTLLDWDAAAHAALLREAGLPEALVRLLAGYDRAVIVSRNPALAAHARAHVADVVLVQPMPSGGVHVARHYADAASLPFSVPAAYLGTEDERLQASGLLRDLPPGFLAVHPGSGSPAKNWPAERFAALVERLGAGQPFALVQGPADDAACAPLRSLPEARTWRHLAPRVLGAALGRAGLYVGNDSGVSHLAAAWGVPTLALFGPTDPYLWAPLGPRVATLRAPNHALAELSVDAVSGAARPLALRAAS